MEKKWIFVFVTIGTIIMVSAVFWIVTQFKSKDIPVTFPHWKQDIVRLQLERWPDSVNELDCTQYDEWGKAYCESEKAKFLARKNEITWEGISQKGSLEILSANCSEIESNLGKKYCSDRQKRILDSSKEIDGIINSLSPERKERLRQAVLKSGTWELTRPAVPIGFRVNPVWK